MTNQRINDIVVLVKTDRGLFECKLSDDAKFRIFKREIDVRKITLVGEDLSFIFSKIKNNDNLPVKI